MLNFGCLRLDEVFSLGKPTHMSIGGLHGEITIEEYGPGQCYLLICTSACYEQSYLVSTFVIPQSVFNLPSPARIRQLLPN